MSEWWSFLGLIISTFLLFQIINLPPWPSQAGQDQASIPPNPPPTWAMLWCCVELQGGQQCKVAPTASATSLPSTSQQWGRRRRRRCNAMVALARHISNFSWTLNTNLDQKQKTADLMFSVILAGQSWSLLVQVRIHTRVKKTYSKR